MERTNRSMMHMVHGLRRSGGLSQHAFQPHPAAPGGGHPPLNARPKESHRQPTQNIARDETEDYVHIGTRSKGVASRDARGNSYARLWWWATSTIDF